jgi:hypothetical protein
MASVSNVSLTLADGSTPGTRNVTVKGKLGFDAGEVGKVFRMEVKIFGEDKPGDNLPPGDSVGDDDLYTFNWGSLFHKKPFKQILVTTAGIHDFTETRAINAQTLDEDSGMVVVGKADINTPIYMPRQDEVYARVTLAGAPVTARSTTVIAGAGV